MPRAVAPKALDKAPSNGAREITGEFDVLKQPMPPLPITYTRARIGIHTSTSGGVEKAVERAYRLGCNAMQIFSSSPRMWRAASPAKTPSGGIHRPPPLPFIYSLLLPTTHPRRKRSQNP